MSRYLLVVVFLFGGGCISAPPPCPCPEPLARPAAPAQVQPQPVAQETPGLDLSTLMKSIVQIKVKVAEKSDGTQVASSFEYGTGFFIDRRGRILTSAHVVAAVDDPRDLTVMVQGRPMQARVIYKDRQTDLAVLLVDAPDVVPLDLAAQPPRLGQKVFAVGFPFVDVFRDSLPAVSVGHLAGTEREIDYASERIANLLLTDAFVADGCSGGPLLDESGRVIGVLRFNLSKKGTWLGLSFAQPIGSLPAKQGGLK